MPFRDVYRSVGIEVNEGKFQFSGELNHTHKGSIGNLCNEEIKDKMKKAAF
jgi:argininosuccinate lyase